MLDFWDFIQTLLKVHSKITSVKNAVLNVNNSQKVELTIDTSYVYMDTFCFNRNEINQIDESEHTVYMNAE